MRIGRQPPRALLARRSVLAGLGAAVLGAGVAHGQTPGPVTGTRVPGVVGDHDEIDEMRAWVDAYGRPTVQVFLNGEGPFDFLVDTGANKTVVAMRHIETLGAPFLGMVDVHGTTGAKAFPLAKIGRLVAGSTEKSDLSVAVVPDRDLLRGDGILGADVFAGRRLTFDMRNQTVTVDSPARNRWRRSRPNLTIRNGALAEVDGRIGRVGATLMLDTGADECIMNSLLYQELRSSYRRLEVLDQATVRGVTGHVLVGDYVVLPDVRLGNVIIRDAGAVATDAPVFDIWGLNDEPTMIVGVNVLSRLDKFAIDYGARIFEATPLAMIARNEVENA